uniref:ATP-dependent DNA ligase family profile domain-containing protein n=1 Tax=viral metagenome TaxID=1070528 RepID=A0A6C0LGG4_9ZZZZ
MQSSEETEKFLPKKQLTKCIKNIAEDLGLTEGEFKEYSEKRLSIKKEHYISVYPKVPDITVTGDKTYITNLKVLLAQNLYIGNKMVKLNDKLSTLLKIKEPPIGWYVSEKYDGIRAIWDGEKFISRGQKVFTYVPDYFIELMPPGVALDGEIWISRNNFKEVSRISTLKVGSSKSQKQIDYIWKGTSDNNSVKYMVYDLPNSNQPFETRMKLLEQIINDRKQVWNNILENVDECPIKFTKQTQIENMAELVNTYKELTSKGAEGVMLRAPNSPYETKRSKYLLKYKIKDDAEAIVRGYTMGTGKYKGLLGSLDCELILDQKPSRVMFNIGTGFTDKDRTEYNNSKSSLYIPIGSIVSFSYMELSQDSVPRHPVYRGIRDDFMIKQNTELESKENELLNQTEKDYIKTIISSFTILIKNEETQKETNWQFKRKAYKQVIDILSNSSEKIDSVQKTLKVLRAGGAKLDGEEAYFTKNGEYKSKTLQKISEIIRTGVLTKAIEIQDDPKVKSITELTTIPEIGPSKAEKLYKDGITTIAELIDAFKKDSKLLNSKQSIGLKYHNDLEKRIPRSEMDSWNEFFTVMLKFTIERMKTKPEGVKMQLVGSYRRKAQDSGDIDILLSSKDPEQGKKLMTNFIKELLKTDNLDTSLVFSSGTTKFMGLGKIEDYYRHIDIFYYSEKEYPFALLFSTGSGQFNIEMRTDAVKKGYSLSEKELVYKDNTKVTTEEYKSDIGKDYPTEEKDIFYFLGLVYIEPENRQSGAVLQRK